MTLFQDPLLGIAFIIVGLWVIWIFVREMRNR